MSSRNKEEVVEEIPEKLYDETAKITYKRLRFFGKVSTVLYLDHFWWYFYFTEKIP